MATREELLYSVFDAVSDGIIEIDDDKRISFINAAGGMLFRIHSGSSIGKNITDIIAFETQGGEPMGERMLPIGKALKNAETENIDVGLYVRIGKDRFPVSLTVLPKTEDDAVVGAFCIFKDVSQLWEIERASSEFASIASHQLRTPVATLNWLIQSFVDSFKDKELSEKQRTDVNDLIVSINRMAWLIEDLLNLSRIQLGQTLIGEPEPIDLNGFIGSFIKSIRPYARVKQHTIEFRKEKELPAIVSYPKILYNVLQNLVSNAIDYSPGEETVVIGAQEEGDQVKIWIENNGPAIPKNEQKHIFEKFFRGESVRSIKTGGTGLGLFIVKSFVEQIGGSVGFISGEERGATFWFTVPVRAPSLNN